MATKRITLALLTLGILAFVGIAQSFRLPSTFAQSTCQSFAATGKEVCGRFLQYWHDRGGLAQQGYPISNEFQERSALDGKSYTVQYFERAVFELHPENQPPNDVLLSQLGTLQFRDKYPTGDPSTGGAQAQLPSTTVYSYFDATKDRSENGRLTRRSLLSVGLLKRIDSDAQGLLLAPDFPQWKTIQDAPRKDFTGNGPTWVLLLNDAGNTVAVFTLVKEDGKWKIDNVEPNGLSR